MSGQLKTITAMHPTTFTDNRGSIDSFFPDDKIVEYNLITTNKGDERGYHYHPEFVEYILFVDGICEFTEYDGDDEHTDIFFSNDSLRIPKNVPHSFRAVSDLKFVSMLTKRWDDCDVPLITIRNH